MDPGFVQVIHPGLGAVSVSEVPESSLYQLYRSGWRLLADDEIPVPVAPEEPEPVTLAEATAESTAEEK